MSTTQVHSPPKLGLESAGVPMTPEEFDAVEEWDECYRYELIHGVLVVSPLPLEQEADPNELLGYLLRRYGDDHPQGSALNKTLPELPGFELPLARLLAAADEWEETN
jgi:Uma2 family endonuclease